MTQQKPGRRYGTGKTRISFFLTLTLPLFISVSPLHAFDSTYLDGILASAVGQKLYDDPYWHILVHYKQGLLGMKSLVDDPRFFLAKDGRTNPRAELEATIRAFFEPSADEKDTAVCRFVARYEWIKEKTGLNPEFFPTPECRSFSRFLEMNRPESATLVFPTAHLNSPASMFGHTLLTIETTDKSKLLAHSVSYSAFAGDTFGPLFAVKGLFGLYPGYFSVLPYYAKLQQYSDVDHRDIWEYPLNLTEPEIRRMMLHVREMDSIASDYFFFSENCSYLLYFLLEAARPGIRLTDEFHKWLIPLDSVRAIDRQGLITSTAYRPSRTTKIRHLAASLPESEQDRAIALAKGNVESLPPESGASDHDRRITCELAGEYLQYLYTKHKLTKDVYQERLLNILRLRSGLGPAGDEPTCRIQEPVRPDRGHHSNRLSLGTGTKRGEAFQEIRFRPAYHHLMDSDAGYIEGAQLIFADATIRRYESDRKLTLESLDIIDIFSLTPRDRFFQPVSWKIKTGLIQTAGDDGEDHLVYQVNPGGGFALKSGRTGLMYAMLETDLHVSGALQHNHAAGVGASAGMMKTLGFWKVHVFARDIYYGLGDSHNAFEGTVQQSFTLRPDQSVSVDISRLRVRDLYQTEARLLWSLFF